MSITDFAIDHLSDFYEFSRKTTVKNLIKENIGRFVEYESTDLFLLGVPVKGIEKFSKKDKNLLVDALKNNPFNSMIVNYYNDNIDGLDIEDKTEFIKRLNTLSKFLEAIPYSEPGFQVKAYQKVIDWAINNESGNFDILIKGFNNYVEVSVLNGLFSDDMVENKRAIEDITERAMIKEEIEKKSVVSTGIAGAMSLGLASVLGEGSEMAASIIPKVTALVGKTAFAPTMVGLAHVGIGVFAFYKTFQIINGVTEEIKVKRNKTCINGKETSKLADLENVKDYLRNQLFKDVLVLPEYDLQNKENQKYLDLLLFANEKLTDSGLRVPEQIIHKHNLTHREINILNSIDYDRVHQISNVKHQDVRKWMLLGQIDGNLEFYYKSVSNAMFLMGNKDAQSPSFDKPIVKNIDDNLETYIGILPETTKRMVNCYLSVVTKDGICPKQDLKNIAEAIGNYGDNEVLLASILTESLQTKMKHFDKPEIKNKEINYFKRIVKFIVGTGDEKLTKRNEEVRNYVLNESHKFDYESTEKVVRKNPGLVEKLTTTAVDVLYKIGDIREKIKNTIGNTLGIKQTI